jgi:hypothetical protein
MWQRCVLPQASIAVAAAVVKGEVCVRNHHTMNTLRSWAARPASQRRLGKQVVAVCSEIHSRYTPSGENSEVLLLK